MRNLFHLIALCAYVEPYTILIYNPVVGTSHVNFFNKISDALVRAGHKVVQLQPLNEFMRRGETLAEIIEVPSDKDVHKGVHYLEQDFMPKTWLKEDADPFELIKIFLHIVQSNRANCRNILNDADVLEKLRSYKFDIAISEAFDLCGYGIFHLLNVPQHLTASSLFMADRLLQLIGAPTAPSYVPSIVVKFGDRMSFMERLSNVFSSVVGYGIAEYVVRCEDDLFQEKYGEDFPKLKDIMLNSTFFFSNTDPLVDFPRPTIHQIVDIGGIAVPKRSTERLNEEWQRVLNLRPKTVLVSFGSVVKAHTMPESFKGGLQKAMRRFRDVTFIWKYEYEHNLGVSLKDATEDGDNVVTVEWVPQTDLLSDSRLTGFLTHGGMGSTNEATVRGVPMVLIPVMVDQFRNARMVQRIGNGIVFEKKGLENPDLVEAVFEQLLNNQTLRERAKEVGLMLENRPFSAEETLVKYTEFAIKSGPFPQLVPYARELGFLQYFLIDIIVSVVAGVLILVIGLGFLVKKISDFISSRRNAVYTPVNTN